MGKISLIFLALAIALLYVYGKAPANTEEKLLLSAGVICIAVSFLTHKRKRH